VYAETSSILRASIVSRSCFDRFIPPALFIAFLLINIVLLIVCIARPFHKDNVHIAGSMYSLMAKIVGLEIIIKKDPAVKINEPYVYIANHQNSFDVITICKAALPGVVTIGKKSLKWIPIFGQIYWLSYHD